jgi:serine/threonine-protein kinase
VELEVVLARALQRTPALRYRSAAAMQKDLQSWQRSAGTVPHPGALRKLMHELFAEEVLEQRRMVSVLMARSDCTAPAPASTRSPSSTSALVVSNNAATATGMSEISRLMEAMGQRHRRAFRSVVAALALLTGFAGGVTYVAANKLSPSVVAASPAPRRSHTEPSPTTHAAAPLAEPGATIDADSPSPLPAVVVERSQPVRAAALARRPALAVSKPAVSTPVASSAAAGPKPDAASVGFLTIDTSPWSQVSVAGRSLGQTPLVGVKLPAGSQLLTLRNPELGIETSYAVQIDAGKTTVRRIGIE